MMNDSGRAPSGQALVSDQAPAGLDPSGFDPSRITEAVERIEPNVLQPIIRRAADEFYEGVLNTVDDYLRDNLDHNLKSHLAMLEMENQRMRLELYMVDRAIGGDPLGHAHRIDSIQALKQHAAKHLELLFCVSRAYEGETRHETALRYLRERDSDGSLAEDPKGLSGEAVPARAEGIAQGEQP